MAYFISFLVVIMLCVLMFETVVSTITRMFIFLLSITGGLSNDAAKNNKQKRR